MSSVAVAVVFVSIVVLASLAKRLNVAYPIVLVIGGIAIGYIPGIPKFVMPPDLVLVLFLPPLLYWESVSAPTGEFRAAAWWILQLAFGLVIFTMFAVAGALHAVASSISWGVALVLGAVVASTDEVAFAAVAPSLHVPRHLIATIEGESLINDATSLILYSVALGALAGTPMPISREVASLVLSLIVSVIVGAIAAAVVVTAWRLAQDEEIQPVISLIAPYLSYLPAHYLGVSAVLAVVVTGLIISSYAPRVLLPASRQRATGFWVTIVFVVNAFIFVSVGLQFHPIVASLSGYTFGQLLYYAVITCVTVIGVRALWVFGQSLMPATNRPEHAGGKADWAHVTVLAWSGMRGGVSLAAALSIPLMSAAGPFPQRNLVIFLTMCVLIATLVGQGGTLPLLVRLLKIRDDAANTREERLALAATARAALSKLDDMQRRWYIPKPVVIMLAERLRARWREFRDIEGEMRDRATGPELYRRLERAILDAQREELIRLRDDGKIDNTVMRRIQMLLDVENTEVDILMGERPTDIDPDSG